MFTSRDLRDFNIPLTGLSLERQAHLMAEVRSEIEVVERMGGDSGQVHSAESTVMGGLQMISFQRQEARVAAGEPSSALSDKLHAVGRLLIERLKPW